MSACTNPWLCHNELEHTPPKNCVHHATSGSYSDAEPASEDR